MKRVLVCVLTSALVFALAAPAAAMHFEMNGQLRVRSWYLDNYWPRATDGNQKGDFEFVDQRFRVFLNWGLNEYVKLLARADINEGFWGARIGVPSESVETDPITGQINRVILPNTTVAKAPVAFDWMTLQFRWPGKPIQIRIGRGDVSWGTGIFAKSDPRDRVLVGAKVRGWIFGGAYDKHQESFQNELVGAGSDYRGWAAFVLRNVAKWKLGALYVLQFDQTTIGAPVPFGTGTGLSRDRNLGMLDVFAIGATGPVSWKAEVAYVTHGKLRPPEPELDRSGFIGYVGGFFNAGMANLGLEFAYAQGEDAGGDLTGSLKMDQHAPYHSIILFNSLDYPGYDSLYLNNNATPGTPPGNAPGFDQNFANAWSVKGTVTASPTERLTLVGAVLHAKRDEVLPGVDRDMGWEVDGMLSYSLYDNLAYTLGIGYLFTGDFYTNDDGTGADNSWGMMNRIEVRF